MQKDASVSEQPATSEAILEDLRDSGIVMEASTSSGCAFEVPLEDGEKVLRKPPPRLAKLINAPKVKKTKEQKMQELEAKLKKAEKRKQVRTDIINASYIHIPLVLSPKSGNSTLPAQCLGLQTKIHSRRCEALSKFQQRYT